jgi:uncharacterized protein YbcI
MVLIRLHGILTPAEEKLAADPGGHHLVKEVRIRLIEGSHPTIDEMIGRLAGIQAVCLHSDVSLRRSKPVIVITLAEDLEAKLKRCRLDHPLASVHRLTMAWLLPRPIGI